MESEKAYLKNFQENVEELILDLPLQNGKRMTLKDVAFDLELRKDGLKSDTFLSYFRSTPKMPSYESLSKIASYFGVTPDFLCGFNSIETNNAQLLSNLILSAKGLGFNVVVTADKIEIISDDKRLVSFLSEIDEELSMANIKSQKLIKFYGNVLSEVEFKDIKRSLYLYGHNLELDEDYEYSLKELLEKLEEARIYTMNDNDVLYQEKLEEWNGTNGQPTGMFPDDYENIIYFNPEYKNM